MFHDYDPSDPFLHSFFPLPPTTSQSDSPDDGDALLQECFFSVAGIVGFFFILISLFLLTLTLGSCTTTRIVEVETVRTDTIHLTHLQRDSIFRHDSIYLKEWMQGDTVFQWRDRWHTQYVEKKVHDSIYIATHDTVPQPYPVEVEVPAPLSWHQHLRLWLGNILLIALLLAAGYGAFRLWRRFHMRSEG